MADSHSDDSPSASKGIAYHGEVFPLFPVRMYDVVSPENIVYLDLFARVRPRSTRGESEAYVSGGDAPDLEAVSARLRHPKSGPQELARYLSPLPPEHQAESSAEEQDEAEWITDALQASAALLENQSTIAAKVLGRLLTPELPHPRRRQLIVEAEVVRFTPDQVTNLVPILRSFIECNRDSNDPDDLTAVGSAVRKYVTLIDPREIGALASLLDVGFRATLPLDLELEVTKMIARKFRANPPETLDPEPGLSERLFDLFAAYSNVRVLPRPKYKTVAMNALLALAGMCSPKAEKAIEVANTLPFRWFREHLCQELEGLDRFWRAHPLAAERQAAIAWLARLSPMVEPAVS